jgi:proline iminopeptidase
LLFYGNAGHGYFRGRVERRRTGTLRLVPQHPRQPGRRRAGRDRKDEGEGQDRHGEERARVWEKALEFWPPYADYQKKTEREIPVVVLDPVR